jgi:hypothetical protein
MAGGYIYILGSLTDTLYIAVTIKCVPPEDPVSRASAIEKSRAA